MGPQTKGPRQSPAPVKSFRAIVGVLLVVTPLTVSAQPKSDKAFTALVTDNQGIETEIKNVVFYWEERLSDTAFVPHELRHLPVKRGNTQNNIPFDKIKQLDMKPIGNDALNVSVTLANGKTGEFTLSMAGSFRGESDFGQADVPAKAVSKVVMK